MYGEIRRTVKTDRRDVAALAEANRRGGYRATHRVSATQRAVRQGLRSRRQLVQMRSGTVSLVRALLRQRGDRLAGGSAVTVPARVVGLALPADLATTLVPLTQVIGQVSAAVAAVDARLATYVARDPVVPRLRTVPGVGPVVALTFRAFVDDVARFGRASQVSAAIGLVPREASRRSAAIADTSRKPARASSAVSSSKPPGRVGAATGVRPCGRGSSDWPVAAANGSPWWPWRAA